MLNGSSDIKVYETSSEEETYEIGRRFGEGAQAGSVFALEGDLGAGKTVFAKGFAAGLGITEVISSPTFTILQIYDSGRLELYHYDAYRIEDPSEMEEIGYADYFYGEGTCLVEWPGNIAEYFPEHYTKITIEKDLEKGFDHRRITVTEI
ncbi:MAG: tRNA (adenosine(37)-N6)-threonylcarbamoyltransferase complex ATPase subunit type 1 TsaE [Lachnospiraceae bacterium]|nr:tRNA (adenosine(37)-N6)-threonylcarbamoyltransferase complex ATPase subunit type 1 TsaE [Lachnospiraceae bacterium]